MAYRLLTVAASLPITSVECERYFSLMKRVKTDARNRLSVAAASMSIIVATDTPSVSAFAPKECTRVWQGKRKRMREAELRVLDSM